MSEVEPPLSAAIVADSGEIHVRSGYQHRDYNRH